MFRISIFGFRIFRLRPPSAETMNHEPRSTNHDPRTMNYAKQSQFAKKSNAYNLSFYNDLQRKMHNGHLVKTNPIKPNLPNAQIAVTTVYTMTNIKKQRTMNYQKQTQSNPTCGEQSRTIKPNFKGKKCCSAGWKISNPSIGVGGLRMTSLQMGVNLLGLRLRHR